MNQQKSAYFFITVSFVMGMIATTSISGCDSGNSGSTTPPAASVPKDENGNSQIQIDKPAGEEKEAKPADNAEAPATPAAPAGDGGEAAPAAGT
jgi:hypothetical protein